MAKNILQVEMNEDTNELRFKLKEPISINESLVLLFSTIEFTMAYLVKEKDFDAKDLLKIREGINKNFEISMFETIVRYGKSEKH